jgi:hypothetical protein
MPTTTNNGWTTPADTDLVKNGALAIRTLGNAIDTTLGVYAAPGLVHIKSYSPSAVSALSLDANTFSSTYSNYLIQINVTTTNSTEIRFRMRLSGTDATGNNYVTQYIFGTGSTTTTGNTTSSGGYCTLQSVAGKHLSNLYIFNPNDAVNTLTINNYGNVALATGQSATSHGVATAYDSITIYPDTGTITGTIVVYGVKK